MAQEHGLFVIEDAAQGLGGEYHGKKACALGEIGCASFFPAKPLGCYGDGGAVFTDDDVIPCTNWLADLWTASCRWSGDSIFGGKILPLFPPSTPDWLRDPDLPCAALVNGLFSPELDRTVSVFPGLFGRLFGKRFIDRSGEVFEIASAVHDVLKSSGFAKLRWRLDGYPDDAESTPEPIHPKQQTA